tara:strand:+ start:218 stop:889 length:672 start_codon:yes stop_codon:yes gene_type:complete
MKKKLTRAQSAELKENLAIIGGLSNPSKMPWYGWSTSAFKCNTGTKLRDVKGSVCENCYACKGFYPMPNVQRALDHRLQCLEDPRFVDAFVRALEILHERDGEDRFRWHDSGDIQSVEHFEKLVEIANRLPQIRFYLPTKETKLVSSWVRKHPGELPKNLMLKISHPMVGETYGSKSPADLDFTTVGVEADNLFQCPAPKQKNKCLDCDACWRSDFNINYTEH